MGCIKSKEEVQAIVDVELSQATGYNEKKLELVTKTEDIHNPIVVTKEPKPEKADRAAAKSKLKDVLQKASGNNNISSSPVLSSSASTIRSSINQPKSGKCGYLYRKNEDFGGEGEQFIQLWVVLMENKLYYYTKKPTTADDELVPRGYLTINKGGHCNISDEHNIKNVSLSGQGKYCFIIVEPALPGSTQISVIFSAISDSDRIDWMEKLIEGFEGLKHQQPNIPLDNSTSNTRLSLTNFTPDKTIVKKDTTTQRSNYTIEFPKLTGALKKKAVGGTFGMKTIKKRFFKLEEGELKYYEDEKMKPSQLKGAFHLKDCKLIPNDKDKKSIMIETNDGKLLDMSADTDIEAKQWIQSLQETLLILSESSEQSVKSKKRKEDIIIEKNNDDVKVDSPKRLSQTNTQTNKTLYKTETSKATIRIALQDHFLLNGIDNIEPLIDSLQLVVGLPGDVIITQNTIGDLFFVLETGSTQIYKNNVFVGCMKPGTAFGELALMSDVKRAATIRTDTVSRLWSLDRATFRRVLISQEGVSKEEKIAFLRGIKIFEKLHDLSLSKVADALNISKYAPGIKIFKQGDIGNCMFIVVKGNVSLTQATTSFGPSTEIAKMAPGTNFGEHALIQDESRNATAIAIDNVTCYTLDRNTFTNILGDFTSVVDENVGTMILKKVSLLKDLNDNQLQTISRRLIRTTYTAKQQIIKQDDDGNSFFMIATGEVSVVVNGTQIAVLATGAFFGEMAILNSEKRNATVIANVETTCLILERADFNELLGPLSSILEEEANRRKSQSSFFSALSTAFIKSSPYKKNTILTANSMSSLKVIDFDNICVISNGKFGAIKCVFHPQTNTYYALKAYQKTLLLENKLETHIFKMRDLYAGLINPFLATLFGTDNDSSCLYMLTELVGGGDFWSLLYDSNALDTTSIGGINIPSAMFYSANVLSAYTYLHDKGITLRNLKPENICVDKYGYLKIVDFMYSKKLLGVDTSTTICGNLEYISYEMVLSKPHNRAVDYWALGIFLYELLTRTTPFEHATTAGIFQRVLTSSEFLSSTFPAGFDQQDNGVGGIARDLIMQLLNCNAAIRLGMLRNGSSDVWAHPFFRGIPMDSLLQNSRAAPYVPNLTDKPCLLTCDTDSTECLSPQRYVGKIDFTGF